MVVPGTLRFAKATLIDADASADVVRLRRTASGDVDAHRQLYERHAAAVFAFLVARTGDRAQAEDVLQEVMIAVWRGAGSFRGESAARTWLISIAAHKASRALRDARRTPGPLVANLPAPGKHRGPSPHAVPSLHSADEHLDVSAAIAALPEPQRTVVVLFFFDGLSLDAIAALLNVPLGTVKSRLFRAKAGLKAALQVATSRPDRLPRQSAPATDDQSAKGLGDVR